MTGPKAGPTNVIHEKRAIAFPLSIGPQISAKTPGTLLYEVLRVSIALWGDLGVDNNVFGARRQSHGISQNSKDNDEVVDSAPGS